MSDGTRALLDDMQQCGPAALYLVPRVVQKIYDGILLKVSKMKGVVKYAFSTALAMRTRAFDQQKVDKQVLYYNNIDRA